MPPSQETITLAAIGLAAISPFGAYLTQERRIRNERARERDRKADEAKAADLDRLRALIDEAMLAAQRGMTDMESVGPRRIPAKAETDKYAEAVRLAAWRMAIHLGDGHEIVAAYRGVIASFNHWNDVAIGSVAAAQRLERPDQAPRPSYVEALLHRYRAPMGATEAAWHRAREQTRDALRGFSEVALRYVGIPSFVAGDAPPRVGLAPYDSPARSTGAARVRSASRDTVRRDVQGS